MTIFLPRSAWTSAPRGGAASVPGRVQGVASHWPGTTTDRFGVESQASVAGRIRGWWDYHVNGRGWADIGYTVAGDQAGRVWDLRGTARVGAHCASPSNQDANWEWHGFLWILGDREEPSAALVQAFWDWRRIMLPRFPRATALRGHREVPGAQTSCPGDEVIQAIRAGEPEDDMPLNAADRKYIADTIEAALVRRRGRYDNGAAISVAQVGAHVFAHRALIAANNAPERLLKTRYREFVDQNGNGVRDLRTIAEILFHTHAAAIRSELMLRMTVQMVAEQQGRSEADVERELNERLAEFKLDGLAPGAEPEVPDPVSEELDADLVEQSEARAAS